MSYKLEYNNYVLQNSTYNNINVVEGIGLPPIRVSEANKTGAHGGNVQSRKYGMRTIAVEGYIYTDDLSQYYSLRHDIVSAFSITTNTNLILTRSDNVAKSIDAKVVYGPEFKEEIGMMAEAAYRIEFRCDDPFFNDQTITPYTTGLANFGGTPVPSPVASPLGSITSNTIVLNNVGDIESNPVFIIGGNVSYPTITNLTTGLSFRINTVLNSSEQIYVYKNQRGEFVLKNGSSVRYLFTGTIFPIVYGTNVLAFTANSYSAEASLQVQFTSKYLTL